MDIKEHKSKSIHELEVLICGMIGLQLDPSSDVAIPFLQGAPGGGKTSIVNSWCKKYDWNLLSIHLALKPLEELTGIPLIKKVLINETEYNGTDWTFPEILTKVYDLDQKKPTIIFLDDFHLCSPDHLALGFEWFTTKSIHGFKLPNNSAFLLAGNNSSKSGTKAGNSAIVNRCAMFPVHMDFDYWKKSFAFPSKLNFKILSFLSNQKNRKYFHMEESTNKPWSSPRSWTRFSNVLNPLEEIYKNNIPFSDLIYFAEAHVGAEAATEFTAYYKLYLETEMDKVFNNKKNIEIPSDMTGQYIYMLSAVGEFFNRVNNKDKKVIADAYNTFGKITLEIAKKNTSIATVGVSELVDSGNIHIYVKFKNTIKEIDPVTTERLTDEFKLI